MNVTVPVEDERAIASGLPMLHGCPTRTDSVVCVTELCFQLRVCSKKKNLRLHACLVHELGVLVFTGYMCPWVTRSLALGRWLIRKTRQVQHNVSHCGVPSWRRVQAHPNSSSEKGKQNGHITCLKHINLGGTWWCCWKVDSATFHAGFCLAVGEHDATTAKFCRNANACFLNVSIAALDSIDRVQPRSKTTRLDGWQGSKGLPPSMKCDVSVRAKPPSS